MERGREEKQENKQINLTTTPLKMANEQYIDKEYINLQDMSHIVTNKLTESPATTKGPHQATSETD